VAGIAYLLLAQQGLRQGQILTISLQSGGGVEAAVPPGHYEASGRRFVLREDQQAVTELDPNDHGIWSREFGAPITAASITSSFSAWGFLDGTVHLLDVRGSSIHVLDRHAIGLDSLYPCVYAVGVSKRGDHLALLYGLEPQYFAMYRRTGPEYELLMKKRMNSEVRKAQPASFSNDGGSVLVKTGDGMEYHDLRHSSAQTVHGERFPGESDMILSPFGTDSFAFLLDRNGARFAGMFRNGSLSAMFPVLPAVNALQVKENGFVIRTAGQDSISFEAQP
jgi:hypothetical protein